MALSNPRRFICYWITNRYMFSCDLFNWTFHGNKEILSSSLELETDHKKQFGVAHRTSIIIIIIIIIPWEFFFTSVLADSLSLEFDRKSSQFSRTLFSILAVLNNTVVWMVSTHPLISNSSSPFINPLVVVPRKSITIGIIGHFHVLQFFQFSSKAQVLILLYFLSILPSGQPGLQSPQFCRRAVSSGVGNLSCRRHDRPNEAVIASRWCRCWEEKPVLKLRCQKCFCHVIPRIFLRQVVWKWFSFFICRW